MTELEILIHRANELTESLRVAWKDVSNPLLTSSERCQVYNRIDQHSTELRSVLVLMKAEVCRDRSLARHGTPQIESYLARYFCL
jgi:hypothetical protein